MSTVPPRTRAPRGPFDPRLAATVPEVRGPVAVLGGVGVVAGLLTVGQVAALAGLVTDLAAGRSVTRAALLVAALFAVRGLFAGLGEQVAVRAATRASGGLRRRLVAHELAGPGGPDRGADGPDPGLTTLIAQGCASIEGYVTRYLPALVAAAVLPPVVLVVLALVDPWSALVVVLTLPLLPVFAALVGRATQDATQRRWQALADLSGHFADVLHGLPTLVGYGRGDAQAATVRAVSERHRAATTRTLRIAFLSSTALEIVATLSVALVAVLAGVRLAAGGLDLHTGLLAILLAPEAYSPVRRVGAEFHAAADGASALDTVLARLGGPPAREACDGDDARDGDGVWLDEVTVTHADGVPVLDRVTLRMPPRPGLTVVTGPSGAGKTTLLEVLAGLRPAAAGRVVTTRSHLVSQRPFLLPGTVRSNLLLGSRGPRSDHELRAALRLVGLAGPTADTTEGAADSSTQATDDATTAGATVLLDTRVGDDGAGLSAGQRARLVLARATLSTAPLLLLDEPTAHVDAETCRRLDDVVVALARTRQVVVVAHRTGLVERGSHHVRVQAGHVSTRGAGSTPAPEPTGARA